VGAWLADYVLATHDQEGYLDRIGRERLERLKVPEQWAAPVNYGRYGGEAVSG